LRIRHGLDNRLTDGGEVVGLANRPRSAPQKHVLVLISVTGWVSSTTIVRLEGLVLTSAALTNEVLQSLYTLVLRNWFAG
jgi:hypothetical protein